MKEPLTILVACGDEEATIGETVETLRARFPQAEVLVADDGNPCSGEPRVEARQESRRLTGLRLRGTCDDDCVERQVAPLSLLDERRPDRVPEGRVAAVDELPRE